MRIRLRFTKVGKILGVGERTGIELEDEKAGILPNPDWLRANRPANYTPGIMHGDYQFANVMFAHGAPARLAAIVDWEMTTIGDPLLDLGWCLLGYDGEEPAGDGYYLDMTGMPKRSELLAHYEKVSGRSTENIDYYLVLANWKLGIMLEKTYAASLQPGNRVDPAVAAAMGRRASAWTWRGTDASGRGEESF